MKKSFTSTLLKGLFKGTLGLLAYDFAYRLKHTRKQSYQAEVNLNELDMSLQANLAWIDEEHYEREMNIIARPYIEQFEHAGEIPVGDVALSYLFYLKDSNRPTVFIVHGFNEYKEKYYEVVYYLLQLDYNVLIYDARGHGSSRVETRNSLIDIQHFDYYIEDLKEVIESIKETYELNEHFYLFAHSMGGAVSTGLIKKYPKLIKAAVLSSPMFSVDTYPYPRSLAHAVASGAGLLNLGHKPIPAQGSNEIIEASTNASKYIPNPDLTHSQQREKYAFDMRLESVAHPTSGGTYNWLATSLEQVNKTVDESVLKNIETPLLVFRSIEDKVVRGDGIFTAATYLPQVELIAVDNAGHCLYQEQDEITKPYFSLISYFLNQYS